jgi:hypothetical protein
MGVVGWPGTAVGGASSSIGSGTSLCVRLCRLYRKCDVATEGDGGRLQISAVCWWIPDEHCLWLCSGIRKWRYLCTVASMCLQDIA